MPESIFRFVRRSGENTDLFTTVLLVPTGIARKSVGTLVTRARWRLLGQVSDRLILHPNVVNASDVNDMPDNALYVEGASFPDVSWARSGCGARQNRVLAVIDAHKDLVFVNAARQRH